MGSAVGHIFGGRQVDRGKNRDEFLAAIAGCGALRCASRRGKTRLPSTSIREASTATCFARLVWQ
jgi:hypothetical protein